MTERQRAETEENARRVVERADHLLSWPERLKRWGIAYLCIVTTAAFAVVGWAALDGRATLDKVSQVQSAHSADVLQAERNAAQTLAASKASAKTLHLVLGCFHPNTPCSNHNAKATAEAFQKLGVLIVDAALCTTDNGVAKNQRAELACIARWQSKATNG